MADLRQLRKKIEFFPASSGVYIFKDKSGRILYIGKARSLRKRLKSYFGRRLESKTQAMLSAVEEIEYIETPSESRAIFLESALVKKHQPQYNIDLKDDKSFLLIKISAEEFPSLSLCRSLKRKKEPGAVYFGPYINARFLRRALNEMRRIFGFRSCRIMPKRACLYYRLKLCPAPCIGRIGVAKYREIIEEIKLFLDSRYGELIAKLSKEMVRLSGEKKFEEAALLRDRISALSVISQANPAPEADETEDLKNTLGLKKPPLRIEAFDISNLSGKEACGSMVSFFKGVADKRNYRKFRVKTVGAADDCAMIREVVGRRYRRLARERLPLPDLILIDGGRGQLSSAERALKGLRLKIPLASIAKKEENIYLQGKARPIKLKTDTPALNLIRRIRDEAHRFAVSYHRLLRRKKVIGS